MGKYALTILTEDEMDALRGMISYWNEVNERDDSSPLTNELNDLYRRLGTRLLWIVEEYRACQLNRDDILPLVNRDEKICNFCHSSFTKTSDPAKELCSEHYQSQI